MTIKQHTSPDQVGLRIAARLSDGAADLPSDISERLKASRMQALAKRKVVSLQLVGGVSAHGASAALHGSGNDRNIWNLVASLFPLVALIVGLLAISVIQEQDRAREIAEVDVELLSDDLPPAAYTDVGFINFMTINRRD